MARKEKKKKENQNPPLLGLGRIHAFFPQEYTTAVEEPGDEDIIISPGINIC